MGRHYEYGVKLFQLRRYREAANAFSRELDDVDTAPMAYSMRASSLINLNQNRAAETDVLAALALEPDLAFAHYLRSIVNFNRGRSRAALHAVMEAIRLDPSPMAFHHLATIHFQANRVHECLAATAESLASDPQHLPSLILRAKTLATIGQTDASRELLRQALILEAENPEAHRELGVLALANGNSNDALDHLLEARRIDPINHNDRLSLAAAYGRFLPPFRQLNSLLAWMQSWSAMRRWLVVAGISTVLVGMFLVTRPSELHYSIPAMIALIAIVNIVTLFATFNWIAKFAAQIVLRRDLDMKWHHFLFGSGEIYNVLLVHGWATASAAVFTIFPQLSFVAVSLVVLGWDSYAVICRLPWILSILLTPAVFFAIICLAVSGAIWMPEYPAWVLTIWLITLAISFVVLLIRIALDRNDSTSDHLET
jgi:tetratricopeptide (TPR) repeat protein